MIVNRLFLGDNLQVLSRHVDAASVDLVYLDPPFKSDRNYHHQATDNGSRLRAKKRVFTDIWSWDDRAQAAFEKLLAPGGRVADTLRALRQLVGDGDLLAYLAMMTPRLSELHRVLKPTGTIYLHCDPSASHYLKILMDAVFGIDNMRNEIIWCYRGGGVPRKDFARKHDVILRYSKSDDYYFNVDAVRVPYSDDVLNSLPSRYDKSYRANKVYAGYRPHPDGKHPDDWWPIQAILPSSGERRGYPTQKPKALLERIIKASTRPGDVVLDPFCGSGTSLVVAESLGRQWLGIDVSELAMEVTGKRLTEIENAPSRFECTTVTD